MKKSDVLFAIVRKSSAVLKEYADSDNERKFVIQMKYNYSKLQPALRNMIRVMATDIDRFEMKHIEHLNAVLEKFNKPEASQEIYPVLIDINSGNQFVICQRTVTVNGTVVFKDEDHAGFIVAFGCLLRAKENKERAIKEHKAEEERLSILSEFR